MVVKRGAVAADATCTTSALYRLVVYVGVRHRGPAACAQTHSESSDCTNYTHMVLIVATPNVVCRHAMSVRARRRRRNANTISLQLPDRERETGREGGMGDVVTSRLLLLLLTIAVMRQQQQHAARPVCSDVPAMCSIGATAELSMGSLGWVHYSKTTNKIERIVSMHLKHG